MIKTRSQQSYRLFSWTSFFVLMAALTGPGSEALAQTGTLFVEGTNVGIGTATPQTPLHVEAPAATALIESTSSSSTDHASLLLRTTGGDVNSEFTIRTNATTGALEMKGPSGGAALKFRVGAANNSLTVGPAGTGGFARVGIGTAIPAGAAGEHTLDVNGVIFQRGTTLHADYVFAPDYHLYSIEEQSAYMWENRHLPAIPPRQVDDNGLEVVELGAHRRGMVEELEKAHIYIAQLHELVSKLSDEVQNKDEALLQLEERLTHLEQSLD